MSDANSFFTKEENEWSDKIDRIMTEAVTEATAENKRLGLKGEGCKYPLESPVAIRVREDDWNSFD